MTGRHSLWTLLVAALFALIGCSSNPEPMPSTLAAPEAASTTQQIVFEDLLIAPADMLEISVFGVPELDGRYQVDYLGRIKVPLIGDVNAMGLSTYELSGILEKELGQTYLQDPDVNVVIAESTEIQREITVEGSVTRPGIFPIESRLTLLQAIALAGGPSETANPRRVVVFRNIDGQRNAAAFNLLDIREGRAEDPIVFANDIVVMDGSEARRTYGEFIRSIPLLALFVAM